MPGRGGDVTIMRFGVPESGQYCSHSKKFNELGVPPRNLYRRTLFARCPILEVDTMTKILLATVAVLAFTAPTFAQQDKPTTGQAPPSGASSFFLAQDTGTMKCQVVNAQPAAGGTMKVIGAAHPTQASAQTALTADKTCK